MWLCFNTKQFNSHNDGSKWLDWPLVKERNSVTSSSTSPIKFLKCSIPKPLTLVYLNTPYSILKLKAFLIAKGLISFRSNTPNIQGDCESVSHSAVSDSAIPRPVACQAPLSMGFSRQENWSGWPFPSPGGFPDPGMESGSPTFFTICLQWRYRNI